MAIDMEVDNRHVEPSPSLHGLTLPSYTHPHATGNLPSGELGQLARGEPLEDLERWLGDQLKNPLGQLVWLVVFALVKLALHFSSRRRRRKRRTPPKSPGTA